MEPKPVDDESDEQRNERLLKREPWRKPRSEWTEEDWEAFAEFYVDESGWA